MVVFGQGGCKRTKWCIRAKILLFGHKWLYSGIVVVFEQTGYIRVRWLTSGKSYIRAKWLYSGKLAVFGQKWLYSGVVVLFG